jgi:hypothetical protein
MDINFIIIFSLVKNKKKTKEKKQAKKTPENF